MKTFKVWLLLLPAWLAAFIPAEASAQEVESDSAALTLPPAAGEAHQAGLPSGSYAMPQPAVPSAHDSLATIGMQHLSHRNLIYLPFGLNPTLLFRGDYDTSGTLYRYRLGQIRLEGSQNSLPGIGRTNEAAAMWSHRFGSRLALQAVLTATQLDMEHLNRHVFGIGGAMRYQLAPKLSLQLFGHYDTGHPYDPYGRQWGGSIDWQATPRFGIEGGIRRSYDPVSHCWETWPIVAPYYNFDHLQLKIDIGPLLQELLKDAIYGDRFRTGPTIAPPRHRLEIR